MLFQASYHGFLHLWMSRCLFYLSWVKVVFPLAAGIASYLRLEFNYY